MKTTSRSILLTGTLLLTPGLGALGALGQTLGINPLVQQQALRERLRQELLTQRKPADTDNLSDFQGDTRTWVKNQVIQAKPSTAAEAKDMAASKAPQEVAKKTTAISAPDGFADRVKETISDFLPLFGLSMDAVSTSEDKKSASLRLNSHNLRHGALGVIATVAEPEVFKKLSDEIVEASRDKEVKVLRAKVDDFGDVTGALTYGYTHPALTWENTGRMYGRNYDLYQPLVDSLLDKSFASVDPTELQRTSKRLSDTFIRPIIGFTGETNLKKINFSKIREGIRSHQLAFTEDELLLAMLEDDLAISGVITQLETPNFDALPTLVDNQPQLTLTASYRSSHEFVGPDATTVSFRYEMGSKNINAVLQEYQLMLARKDPAASPIQALKKVTEDESYRAETKVILSLSYKRIDPYHLVYPYKQSVIDPATGNPGPEISRTATLNLDRSTEWRGSASLTRFFLRARDKDNETGVELPRITLSLEGVWPKDDPLRKNQIIARLSYIMPATSSISMPVTLTWANRSELLGQQDRTFGAHLGISYKMNSGK